MIDQRELLGPPTKADAAYLVLRNEILLGNLPPGSRVDSGRLAGQFGLSVTPLREALRHLEADHLVVRTAHRDVVVAEVSLTEARDLVEMRDTLDLAAVRLAASRMLAEEIEAAATMIEQADEAVAVAYLRTNGIPVASAGSLAVNRAFHRMLYCGSHNSVLIQARDALSVRTERYVILARRMNRAGDRAHHELHEVLLNAIRAHDEPLAAALMSTHYKATGNDFTEVIFGAGVAHFSIH